MLPFTVRTPVIVVVAKVDVPLTFNVPLALIFSFTDNPPFELKEVSKVPELFLNSNRLTTPCPCPPCTEKVVVPVAGVSFSMCRDMLDSRRLVREFQRNIALGVTIPLKNTREESWVSVEALLELMEKEVLLVPEIEVLAAEKELAVTVPA